MIKTLLGLIGPMIKPLGELAAKLAAFFSLWIWARKTKELDATKKERDDAIKKIDTLDVIANMSADERRKLLDSWSRPLRGLPADKAND